MMRYFDELPNTEIASILGCSVDTVYLRLHRALARLRQQLEKLDDCTEVIYAQE